MGGHVVNKPDDGKHQADTKTNEHEAAHFSPEKEQRDEDTAEGGDHHGCFNPLFNYSPCRNERPIGSQI